MPGDRQFRLIEAQRVAERRNAQLAAIIAASSDAIISVGTDLAVQTWNAGAQRLFGYSEGEARGRTITELIVPDAYEAERADIFAAAISCRTAVLKETVRQHKDGRLIPVEINVSPILSGSGKVTGLSVILRDITARKNAEEAQARLAAIVTSSTDAIVGKTLDGIVTSWNEAAERMFGYSASEMIGQSIRRLIPADRQADEDTISGCLARGERVKHFETVRLAKDGRTFDASVTISPLRDTEGRIIGSSKIVRDITERKRTEARLAEREAQLALFVEHAPVGIAMFDDKMRFLAVSRQFTSDYELGDPAEVIGRSVYEIFPDMPLRWREVHVGVVSGQELAHEEDFFPRRDGRIYWVRWLMKPWRNINGRIGGAMLFAEVITKQVEAERALADSEVRFRATFENAAVGIAHLTPDLRWLRVNEALCRILGYPADELVTKSLQDITHPEDLETDLAQIEQMREKKIASYEMDKRYLRKDGTIVWGRATVACVRKSDGSIAHFVSVVEEISARKQAEALLRRQADLLNQSHDAIFTWKIGGGITYWSRGAEVLYGYTSEEVIGRSSHELLRTRSPVPMEEVEAHIAREGSWYGELTHTTREGRLITVESRHVRVSYDGEIYTLETNRDITARKQAEEALRKSTVSAGPVEAPRTSRRPGKRMGEAS